MGKTSQLEMKSSIVDNLLLISEERHYHVCCILVVRMTSTGRNVGGVNVRRCGSLGAISDTDCPKLNQWNHLLPAEYIKCI